MGTHDRMAARDAIHTARRPLAAAVTVLVAALPVGQTLAQDITNDNAPLTLPLGGNGALPGTGTNVRVGDLRQQLERAFAGNTPLQPAAGAPSITIAPAIDVQEEYTDNVFSSAGSSTSRRTSDLITVITPSVGISADTERVQGGIFYSPSAQIYAKNSSQTRVSQNLSANVHMIVLPDTVFVDLQGFATTSSALAGGVQNGLTVQNQQNQTQTYSFSVSPYVQHRFGDIGVAEIGYTLRRTIQNNVNNNGLQNPQFAAQQAVLANGQFATVPTTTFGLPSNNGVNQNVTTNTEHAGFTSGTYFGRVSGAVLATANQYNGTGVLSGAYSNTLLIDVGYAITRTITILGRTGYENIKYSGIPPTRIDDAIWGVGTHLTPNEDSSLTIRYGHQDGFNAAYVDGFLAPTARTRISAQYSDVLTTGLQGVQDALAQSTLDPYGNVIDRTTGAPIFPVSSFFGTQSTSNLVKQQSYSVTASLLQDRDVYSITASAQQQKVVAVAPNQPPTGATNGVYGTLSWSHSISENLNTNVYGQYGQSRTGNTLIAGAASTQSQDTYAIGISANYLFSQTLSGNVLYSYSSGGSATQGNNQPTNLFVVGLHKSF